MVFGAKSESADPMVFEAVSEFIVLLRFHCGLNFPFVVLLKNQRFILVFLSLNFVFWA